MKRILRKLTALTLMIMLVLSLAPSALAQQSSKDTMTIGVDREPVSLDPTDIVTNVKRMMENCIYDTLLTFDNHMTIQPRLAETWEKMDDLTWKFTLRKDVTFHNGDPLKASDVLFTFKRAEGTAVAARAVAMFDLAACEAPDDHTFILKTKEPYAYTEAQLCDQQLSILSEAAVTKMGQDHARNPVGTGPYIFDSWVAGDNITLNRNDNYWGHKSILKTLVFRIITESASRTIDLESGGLDLTLGLPQNDADRIASNPDMQLLVHPNNSVRYIGLNCAKESLKDKRVRQALNYATNTQVMRPVLYGEKTSGEMLSSVPAELPGFNGDLQQYGYDVEKAKALLKEAGVENLELEFMYLANSTNNMLAAMLQQMWGEVGVTLVLKPTESGALSTALNKGEHEICSAGTTFAMGEAGVGLYNFFNTKTQFSSGNRTNLSVPEIDMILDLIQVTTDQVEREKLVYDVQAMVHEEAPMIYLAYQYSIMGATAKMKGFELTPTSMYDFTTIYFE
ncbi:MAG: ABC transporter substrate-binding protein [Christensenellales bacterium]|jgi:peptide/nickel transport system substrate-binding protein